MKFSLATILAFMGASASAFAPTTTSTSFIARQGHQQWQLASTTEVPSDVESIPLNNDGDFSNDELAAGSAPIITARNELLSLSTSLTSSSPTGLFITLPSDRKEFMKAVARLEAIAPTTSDESEPLTIGDWELVATSRKTTLDLLNNASDSSGSGSGSSDAKKNGKGFPKLNPKIKDSIRVTQRIRSTTSELEIVDRIDNVITFDNTSTKLLPTFLNPLSIDKSKIVLVHKAKVQTFVPFRTKLALSSVVFNLAGQSRNLDPEGADVFGLNVPMLNEWMNAGEFDTTYVDGDVRVCRGTIGVLEETRVFVKKGFDVSTASVDADADVLVEDEKPVSAQEEKRKKIATAVENVGKSVQDLSSDVQKTIEKDVNSIKDEIESTVQDIQKVVEDDLKEVTKSVNQVKSAVIGDEDVEEKVDEVVKSVVDLGKDVKESVDGLRSKVDEDVTKIQGAVKDVRGAVLKEDEEKEDETESVVEDETETDTTVESEEAEEAAEDATEVKAEAEIDTDADADADDKKKKKKKGKKNKKK